MNVTGTWNVLSWFRGSGFEPGLVKLGVYSPSVKLWGLNQKHRYRHHTLNYEPQAKAICVQNYPPSQRTSTRKRTTYGTQRCTLRLNTPWRLSFKSDRKIFHRLGNHYINSEVCKFTNGFEGKLWAFPWFTWRHVNKVLLLESNETFSKAMDL